MGQVTAVVTGRSHTCEIAPIIEAETKGDWPWASVHGWKWSLIHSATKPAFSARRGLLEQLVGCVPSQETK